MGCCVSKEAENHGRIAPSAVAAAAAGADRCRVVTLTEKEEVAEDFKSPTAPKKRCHNDTECCHSSNDDTVCGTATDMNNNGDESATDDGSASGGINNNNKESSIFTKKTTNNNNNKKPLRLVGGLINNNKKNHAKLNPLSPHVGAWKARGGAGIMSQSFNFLSSSAHHLKNVFAQPMNQDDDDDDGMGGTMESPAPSSRLLAVEQRHLETDEERAFLLKILRKHYLFEQVEEEQIETLVSVFEKVELGEDDDPILIRQGELVDRDRAYFYVLYRGECTYTVDGVVATQTATPGDSFGELALLYDCPRAATVTAVLKKAVVPENPTRQQQVLSGSEITSATSASTVEMEPNHNSNGDHNHNNIIHPLPSGPNPPEKPLVVLFRVDQLSFRQVLRNADRAVCNSKMELLSHMTVLNSLSADRKAQLAAAMRARPFKEGEYLVRRGTTNASWFLIEHGIVIAKDMSHGANHRWNGRLSDYGSYRDVSMGRYESFGHRSVLTGEAAVADCVAMSPGLAFVIDRETFQSVLGDLAVAVLRSNDEMKLRSIPIVAATTQLDRRMVQFLASQIKEETFVAGTIICQKGEPIERLPGLYIVRKGNVQVEYPNRTETVLPDGYFGDDELLADTYDRTTFRSPYTATVVETCECGFLSLQSCRRILDTYRMGKAQNIREFDSLVAYGGQKLQPDDFKLHRLIGAGTFGQVWLVSRETSDGKRRPYALKVQSKYELCTTSQAKLIVREKNVMAQFHNPFVGKLVSSFQDEQFLYMAMDLYQGGELYGLMHRSGGKTMSESEAMFYVACIAQGIGYMHRLGFVYRDLKPENVMIDKQGYAILIDFGFCKKITMKTYTMCGTPLYLAPEVILNRGYNWSADHWSLGIVLYEMLLGHTPFYRREMTKTDLFRSIIKDRVPVPDHLSSAVLNLISGLLKRDWSRRLGSLANGEDGILEHKWFHPIDHDLMFLKELEAPYLPIVSDILDDSHFENWAHLEDLRHRKYPELTPEQKELFKSF